MYGVANTVQCVGRGKEHVIEQRNRKTNFYSYCKVKCASKEDKILVLFFRTTAN